MIERQTEKYSDEEIHRNLNPLLSAWFRQKFGSFTEPQRYSILNIHARLNTLVSAETGTGKTLSAFTAVISELLNLSQGNQLEDKVYCVYVSPLRALNNDIQRNLLEPLEEIAAVQGKKERKLGIRVAVRTGDTTTSERAKMLRKPPHILITTPETIAILLNAPKFRENLRGVKWCIVDEIHALASNKRGVHLALSLERLQRLAPEMTRIGLSATVAPLELVAEYLVGYESERVQRPCKIVDVSFLKKMDLKVLSPLPNFIDVTPEQVHRALYDTLDKLIQGHQTTLVFTNTRSATERVVHHLKEKFPKKYLSGNIGAHHSSLSREHRLNIENRLKQGKLKCVVCSTSLELGIDIGFIDLVILLGSPKSVARAIQRMGRSGHKLHDQVKGRIIVLDRDDLVECAVLLKNALEKKIDKIQVPLNCLDVLAQHIFGIAIEDKIQVEDLFRLVTRAFPYHSLKRTDFFEVIDYLAGEYTSLELRYVYAKIWFDRETGWIGKRGKMARIIYMTNVGTIPDEAKIKVKLGEQTIGTIDEMFLERLKKNDVFVLGGESYVFNFSRGMTIQVRSAEKRPPTVPSWASEMLPLSFDLALEIQRFRRLMEEKFVYRKPKTEVIEWLHEYLYVDENSANAIYEYFHEQFLFAEIPHDKKLVIEAYCEGELTHLIFHSLFGRRTNDALSKAYAYALSRLTHKDVELSMGDNGFVITSEGKLPIDTALRIVKSPDLRMLLEMALDRTEVLSRRFRHCATRALMILRSYRGKTKSAGRQQMSSRLLISAVRRISRDFCILREARREVLEDLMDIDSAAKVVQWLESGQVKVRKIATPLPSPFAFNLLRQGYGDVMKMEDRLAFIRRIHERVMQRIAEKQKVV